MHIAFLTPEYPHPSLSKSAGLGTSIHNLAKSLVAKGHKVSVIIPYQKEDSHMDFEGIQLFSIASRHYVFANWFFYKKHIQARIEHLHRKHQFDLVEGPDWTGLGAFIKFPVPYVVRLHGTDAYFCALENRKQKKKNFLFEKLNLSKADFILSASQFTADTTRKIFSITKPMTTIYNGIDTSKFSPLPKEFSKKQILYFGTVIRKKGVLDLAHAFNILVDTNPDSTLTFLGKDVVDIFESRSTVEMIRDILSPIAQSRVSFISEVPYVEVQKHLAASAVVCLPSYAEAYPMTWLEAMSMEKALVTSNIGWAKEMMVHKETGYTVHPSDHKKMAHYLSSLLDNPDLANLMGKNARTRVVENFSTEVIVQQNIDYYLSVFNS